MKVLMKGNEALGEAAIRAGCVHFFGYPITPQTEVPEYLVKRLPQVDGKFVQAESEVAAINMVFGAAGVGVKCMTSSSSPGISLMAEGLSYIAACELPCVIINIMRAGPGLGGILPSQSDYLQATKGHGHGDYQLIVLAPSTVQEAVDLMGLAFELAERYRNPVMVCADGMIGQMMEPVEFPGEGRGEPLKDNNWALTGCEGRARRIVNSLYLTPEVLHEHNIKLKKKYDLVASREKRWEVYGGDGDFDLLLVAFGTMARICKTAVDELKEEGLRIGLFRPITLNPFPLEACRKAMDGVLADGPVLTVEMSMGQLVQDVKMAAEGSRTVELYGTAGGIVPSPGQVVDRIRLLLGNDTRTTIDVPANPQWLPVCERAQADGVPCPEVGRDCEVCRQSYARLQDRMTPPPGYH
jgi:2-oxoglutarate ferredoxin oxidoreductase subunit alpha